MLHSTLASSYASSKVCVCVCCRAEGECSACDYKQSHVNDMHRESVGLGRVKHRREKFFGRNWFARKGALPDLPLPSHAKDGIKFELSKRDDERAGDGLETWQQQRFVLRRCLLAGVSGTHSHCYHDNNHNNDADTERDSKSRLVLGGVNYHYKKSMMLL